MADTSVRNAEVLILGAGLAGISAAIYLGRAMRQTLVVHSGDSMATWEPEVCNYLGFPEGISGDELLARGTKQAENHKVEFCEDTITFGERKPDGTFVLSGEKGRYTAPRLLLATGLAHIAPDLPGAVDCLGHSVFFCKDCDGYRVRNQRVLIYGADVEAAEYALAIQQYSHQVQIVTNGRTPIWGGRMDAFIQAEKIPVHVAGIQELRREHCKLLGVTLTDGTSIDADCLFATRGDIMHNRLAKMLDAILDSAGQVIVDHCQRTNIEGLYAAGCVTPANCQMIIAAGHGAIAAQAINRDMFEVRLKSMEAKLEASGGK